MKEIKQLATRDHPLYDVYVSESNLTFWKVVLSGPSDSPYSAGTFLLSLDMGERYPTFHPEARFITKMCHPNINAHGRVCHPLFGRDWTTDTSMSTVIDTIYGLLFQAEVSDPVSTLSTLEYHADGVEFADAVRDHVGRHAMKTREEWRVELVGELDEELSDDGDEDMSGTGEGDVSGTEEEDMSGVGEDEMSGNGEEERSDEDL
jgi:ubiquitin-protein ligase